MVRKFREPGLEIDDPSLYIITRVAKRRTLRVQLAGDFSSTMSEGRPDKFDTDGLDLAVEQARPEVKQPPLYRVVLINDDFTPMEFVVDILESIFGMERTRATQVMLEVHTKGKGICGVYNFEIAETKVAQVMGIARQHQHPLLCTMEES